MRQVDEISLSVQEIPIDITVNSAAYMKAVWAA
jgi:hypothetical protein